MGKSFLMFAFGHPSETWSMWICHLHRKITHSTWVISFGIFLIIFLMRNIIIYMILTTVMKNRKKKSPIILSHPINPPSHILVCLTIISSYCLPFVFHYFVVTTDGGFPAGLFAYFHSFTCVYKYFVGFLWGGSSVLAQQENTEDQLEIVYCPSTFPVPCQ